MRVRITAVGLSGPGLPDWRSSAPVLRGDAVYDPAPYQSSGRSPLVGPERRRATAVTRLALEAAMDAAGPDPAAWDVATVFASSGGEVDTCDVIFDQLSRPERVVSPTQFHNSVHNAASGYWGIASGSQRASTSVACFDGTFAAGLLEAAALVTADHRDALLVAYDCPPPDPIRPFRPLLAPFAVALRISPVDASTGLAALAIAFDVSGATQETPVSVAALEALRVGNPAARALPLLSAIAAREERVVYLECAGPGLLRVQVAPCP